MQWAQDTSHLKPWYVFLLFVFLLLIFLIVFTCDFHFNMSDCHENEMTRGGQRQWLKTWYVFFSIFFYYFTNRYYNDYDR